MANKTNARSKRNTDGSTRLNLPLGTMTPAEQREAENRMARAIRNQGRPTRMKR